MTSSSAAAVATGALCCGWSSAVHAVPLEPRSPQSERPGSAARAAPAPHLAAAGADDGARARLPARLHHSVDLRHRALPSKGQHRVRVPGRRQRHLPGGPQDARRRLRRRVRRRGSG